MVSAISVLLVALLAVGSLLLVALVVAPVLVPVAVTTRDVHWLAGRSVLTERESDVLARYLTRHRRHRAVGALLGVLLALVVGLRWSTVGDGAVSAGPLANVLFCGIVGLVVGALSAESFRLSEPPSTAVAASLAAHPTPARPDVTLQARGLVVTALLAGVVVAVLGRGLGPLVIALGGLAVGVLAEATLRAIAGRRRPVLSDRALEVDLRMRVFASTATAWLQLAAAVQTLAWVLASLPLGDALRALQGLVGLVGLVATLVLLRQASPRPPRGWVVPSGAERVLP